MHSMVLGEKLGKDETRLQVDHTLFKHMVGSLIYLIATRPDLMFVVSFISRFMAAPTQLHLQAIKRVMRYLKGTTSLGIWYQQGEVGNGLTAVRYHFLRDLIKEGTITLEYCNTEVRLVDILTKP
ncbi:hypothetical protein V2J09_009036 [Rumex salicifolius]